MMATETTLMLARYSAWADDTLFAAIKALPADTGHQKHKTLFGSMAGTLNHNYVVDLIWRAHLLREAHGFSSRRDVLYPDISDLAVAQAKLNAWYVSWAGQQTEDSLTERLRFTFIAGHSAQMSRGEMFLHIVNHKTYHRGWVSQMFFEFDSTPPQTDLSVFLCEQPLSAIAQGQNSERQG